MIPAIWLALSSVICSQIALFFVLNHICSKSRLFFVKSHHFCSILHHFCFESLFVPFWYWPKSAISKWMYWTSCLHSTQISYHYLLLSEAVLSLYQLRNKLPMIVQNKRFSSRCRRYMDIACGLTISCILEKKLVSYQSYTYFLQIQRRKAEVLDYATWDMWLNIRLLWYLPFLSCP